MTTKQKVGAILYAVIGCMTVLFTTCVFFFMKPSTPLEWQWFAFVIVVMWVLPLAINRHRNSAQKAVLSLGSIAFVTVLWLGGLLRHEMVGLWTGGFLFLASLIYSGIDLNKRKHEIERDSLS
jgi:hypothetical protein